MKLIKDYFASLVQVAVRSDANRTIRDIIKQGQELMVLLMQSNVCQSIRCDYGHYDHPKWPVQYPQSLGELCLDIVGQEVRRVGKLRKIPGILSVWEEVAFWAMIDDAADLRQLFYHREGS